MAKGMNKAMFLSSFSPATTFPISMFCRKEATELTTANCLMGWGYGAGSGSYALYYRGDLAGDPVSGRLIGGVGVNQPQSAAYSVSATMHAVGLVVASATDARLFVDGTRYNYTSSVTWPANNPDTLGLSGLKESSAWDVSIGGDAQNYAFWNAALTDDEMVSLTRGFSPRRVRPQSLKFYWPAVRADNDLISGLALSLVSTAPAVNPHQRVYGM